MNTVNETAGELLAQLNINGEYHSDTLAALDAVDYRYIRDLKVNVKNVLKSEQLSDKECALLAIAIATNQKNKTLLNYFTEVAKEAEATEEEIAESVAIASLLASNNVLYRFRHFVGKEKYQELPARVKMNIMARPVMGKAFFELISLAVSAVNGCESCVNSHEASVLELGMREEQVWDAIRLASVVVSLDKIVY